MTTIQLEYKVKAEEALASLTEIKDKLEDLKRQQTEVAEGSDEYRRLGEAISALDSQVSDSSAEFERLSAIAEGTANTMKQLKAEAKQLENALASVEPGTEEYTKLAAQLNSVRDRMKDVKESSNLGGSAFEQLSTKTSLLRGDIENLDFAGAGEKIKDLALSAKNIKFSDFTDGLKSAGQGVVSLGRTLLTSPIGIFAAAIGAVVGALAIWKNSAMEVDSTLSNTLTTQKQISEAEQADVEAVNNKTEQLKAQGKSQREILELKQKETREAITALEAQLVTQQEIKRQQVESAERNKRILSGILQFLTLPLQVLLGGVDMLTEKLNQAGIISDETFQKVGNLRGKLNDSVSELLFDPEAVAEENDKTIKETEATLEKLKEQQAGYQNQIADINRQAAEKAAEERRKRRDALEQAIREERDLEIAAIEDASARDKARLAAELSDKVASIKARLEAITGNTEEEIATRQSLLDQIALLEAQHAKDVQAIDDAAYADSDAKLQAALEKERQLQEDQIDLEDELRASRAERNGDLREQQSLEVEALAKEFNAKFARAKRNAELEAQLQEELNARIAEINKKYRDKEKEAEDKAAEDVLKSRLDRIQRAQEALQMIGGFVSELQGTLDAFAEENENRAQAARDQETAALEADFERRRAAVEGNEQATQLLNEEFEKKRKALQNKQEKERNEAAKREFKRNKAFQLAQATIAGAQAVLQAYTQGLAFGPVAAAISAAAAGALAAAQIAAIARTKFQGESGGGGGGSLGSLGAGGGGAPSAGSAQPQPLQLAQTTQPQQQQTPQATPARVYVVESDIQTVTDQRERRDNKATVVE
jgi:hypothetical protein